MPRVERIAPKGFIEVTAIYAKPGDPQHRMFIRAEVIVRFGPCGDDETKIGGACIIGCRDAASVLVTQTPNEIATLINETELLS